MKWQGPCRATNLSQTSAYLKPLFPGGLVRSRVSCKIADDFFAQTQAKPSIKMYNPVPDKRKHIWSFWSAFLCKNKQVEKQGKIIRINSPDIQSRALLLTIENAVQQFGKRVGRPIPSINAAASGISDEIWLLPDISNCTLFTNKQSVPI